MFGALAAAAVPDLWRARAAYVPAPVADPAGERRAEIQGRPRYPDGPWQTLYTKDAAARGDHLAARTDAAARRQPGDADVRERRQAVVDREPRGALRGRGGRMLAVPSRPARGRSWRAHRARRCASTSSPCAARAVGTRRRWRVDTADLGKLQSMGGVGAEAAIERLAERRQQDGPPVRLRARRYEFTPPRTPRPISRSPPRGAHVEAEQHAAVAGVCDLVARRPPPAGASRTPDELMAMLIAAPSASRAHLPPRAARRRRRGRAGARRSRSSRAEKLHAGRATARATAGAVASLSAPAPQGAVHGGHA